MGERLDLDDLLSALDGTRYNCNWKDFSDDMYAFVKLLASEGGPDDGDREIQCGMDEIDERMVNETGYSMPDEQLLDSLEARESSSTPDRMNELDQLMASLEPRPRQHGLNELDQLMDSLEARTSFYTSPHQDELSELESLMPTLEPRKSLPRTSLYTPPQNRMDELDSLMDSLEPRESLSTSPHQDGRTHNRSSHELDAITVNKKLIDKIDLCGCSLSLVITKKLYFALLPADLRQHICTSYLAAELGPLWRSAMQVKSSTSCAKPCSYDALCAMLCYCGLHGYDRIMQDIWPMLQAPNKELEVLEARSILLWTTYGGNLELVQSLMKIQIMKSANSQFLQFESKLHTPTKKCHMMSNAAARGGHCEILEWLKQEKIKWTEYEYEEAVIGNQFSTLQWLEKNNVKAREWAVLKRIANKYERYEIVEWLEQNKKMIQSELDALMDELDWTT